MLPLSLSTPTSQRFYVNPATGPIQNEGGPLCTYPSRGYAKNPSSTCSFKINLVFKLAENEANITVDCIICLPQLVAQK